MGTDARPVFRTAALTLLAAAIVGLVMTLGGGAACDATVEPDSCLSCDCGAGLRYEDARVAQTCSDAAIEASTGCLVPRTVGGLELAKGFRVVDFELNVNSPEAGTSVTIEWAAPDNASIVACALFRCLPEFGRAIDDRGPTMTTFDRCVLAYEYFDAKRGNTDIANLPVAPVVTDREDPRALQELSVGCWAYDDVKVIGASRLKRVPPDLARVFVGSAFAEDCASKTGKACAVASDVPFGLCDENGSCRPRCFVDEDCPPLAELPTPVTDAGPVVDAHVADADFEASVDAGAGDVGSADADRVEAGLARQLCSAECRGADAGHFGLCR